jgi:hypothetical protein
MVREMPPPLRRVERPPTIGEIPVRTFAKDQIDPKPPVPLGSVPLFVPGYGAAKALSRDSRSYT